MTESGGAATCDRRSGGGPTRIVVMGVAGSGKTTIGKRLADRLAARFVDADSVHPDENVAKMAAGIPLTDDDRWPWLDRLREELANSDRIVVTASALKRAYRDVVRGAGAVQFAYLEIDREVARYRTARRTGHFMGPGMITGQFEALEPPAADETDVVTFDGTLDPDVLVDAIVDVIADAVRRDQPQSSAVPSPNDGSTAGERRDG